MSRTCGTGGRKEKYKILVGKYVVKRPLGRLGIDERKFLSSLINDAVNWCK